MITLIDNQDSFVHTLARYVELAGHKSRVIRVEDFTTLPKNTTGIIISPGPKAPKDSPVSNDIIIKFSGKIPILGVCLGHQCIGHVFGAKIIKSKPRHGKTSIITFHDENDFFKDIPNNANFTRYHSLSIGELEDTPLNAIAHTNDNMIMAIKHEVHDTYGVQFHPESILSDHGMTLIQNFLSKCV